MSLRQAEVIDRWSVDEYTKPEFARIPLSEVTFRFDPVTGEPPPTRRRIKAGPKRGTVS